MDPTAPKRDAVFFLEDNLDVLDSTASFFETHGIQVVRSQTVTEAWAALAQFHYCIRSAYIDKTLQRDQNAGMDFLCEAREKYPDVDFALLTAWNLDASELKRAADLQIPIFEKTQARPMDLLGRYYRGHVPNALESVAEVISDPGENAASTADLLFKTRLHEDVLQRREERFQGRIRRIAEDLVQRLTEDAHHGEGPIFIGASEYTADELIQEVCEGSELGLALVDAHFAELDELAQKFYGERR